MLVAFSLEGCIEWQHQRQLVHEDTSNLVPSTSL
jgi:hypothetical protein